MADLAYEVKQNIAENKEQKDLISALRNINFLEGFFNLKVSNEELDYYLQNKDSHKVAWFKSVITNLTSQTSYIDYNPDLIDKHLQELEDFYTTVKQRDIAMVENSLSEIEKRNTRVAALVSGGFHTKGITSLLREKGYSYIVVSPYSSTDIDEGNYHYLLSGQRKPLSELVNEINSLLRIPLAFVRKNFREEYNKEIMPALEALGIPNSEIADISDKFIVASVAWAAKKRITRTRKLPMNKIGAMFNKPFRDHLEDDVVVYEKNRMFYVAYNEEYLAVTGEGKIVAAMKADITGAEEIAKIKPTAQADEKAQVESIQVGSDEMQLETEKKDAAEITGLGESKAAELVVVDRETAGPAQLVDTEIPEQCVTGDTLLPLFRPGNQLIEYIPIISVQSSDYVLSLNEQTRRIEPRRINALLDMGVKPVYRLTTASGRSIKTTANHPYLVRTVDEGEWIKVSELNVGDEIAVPDYQKEKYSPRNDSSSWWSGKTTNSLLVKNSGDGLSVRSRLRASVCWLMFFGRILRSMIPAWSANGGLTAKSLSWVTSTRFSETAIVKTLPLDIPFGERTTSWPSLVRNDISPRCTFSSSKKSILDFQESRVELTGLQDPSCIVQDHFHMFRRHFRIGSLDFFQSRSRLKHVKNQIYHNSSPFKTGLSVADIRGNTDIIFNLHFYFSFSNIIYHTFVKVSRFIGQGQGNAYAQDVVANMPDSMVHGLLGDIDKEPASEAGNNDILWDRVISIEYCGYEHVYDIEVDGTHNFIGNGIFAHNTYVGSAAPAATQPAKVAGLGESKARIHARVRDEGGLSLDITTEYRPVFRIAKPAELVVADRETANFQATVADDLEYPDDPELRSWADALKGEPILFDIINGQIEIRAGPFEA
ncbi:MAG: hypothetical protein KKG01_02980, partial [Candidatus Omnitrophica bacterium]|nr:hypothetical protein [Candidatus Omnitrophota bacterium]